VDLASSSGEEDSFADTSRDEELARKLFGDLNHDILGPPGDGKTINVKTAPPSAANSTDTPTSSPDANETPDGVQDDNTDGGDEAGLP
jgi:hypothetical protein